MRTLVLFLLAVSLWAEPFLAGGRQYGPQGTEARRVTIDRQGFVWVSGDKGTFRFDGERYLPASRLGLPVHSETRVAVTSAPGETGAVWAQSEFGLYRLESGRFHRVDEANKSLPPVAAAGELLMKSVPGLGVRYRCSKTVDTVSTGQVSRMYWQLTLQSAKAFPSSEIKAHVP